MNKNFKKALILILAVVPFSLFLPYIFLNLYGYVTLGGVPVQTPPVVPQYQSAFDNTCAIYTEDGSATGIYLDTGYILTARHVVDINRDGDLDWNERYVRVKFYSSTSEVTTAVVIHVSEGESDFAVIAAPDNFGSGVKLISDEDYKQVKAGTTIFAIGRSGAINPPHFTRGIKSTDMEGSMMGRAAISIFYGSSGGGLFDESSGHLVGLADRIRFHKGDLIPSWAEFTPADVIRKELNEFGLGQVADKEHVSNASFYFLSSLVILLSVLYFKACKWHNNKSDGPPPAPRLPPRRSTKM